MGCLAPSGSSVPHQGQADRRWAVLKASVCTGGSWGSPFQDAESRPQEHSAPSPKRLTVPREGPGSAEATPGCQSEAARAWPGVSPASLLCQWVSPPPSFSPAFQPFPAWSLQKCLSCCMGSQQCSKAFLEVGERKEAERERRGGGKARGLRRSRSF